MKDQHGSLHNRSITPILDIIVVYGSGSLAELLVLDVILGFKLCLVARTLVWSISLPRLFGLSQGKISNTIGLVTAFREQFHVKGATGFEVQKGRITNHCSGRGYRVPVLMGFSSIVVSRIDEATCQSPRRCVQALGSDRSKQID